jgi:predicted Zn-dependent protease
MKSVLMLSVLLLAGCAGMEGLPLGDLVDQKALEAEARKSLQLKPAEDQAGGIPLMGPVSDADEAALGREIAGRLLGAYPLVPNDELQRYVNLVGRYLASQGPRPALPWTFGVIASEDINAFAAPGGYVFVTAGLYRMLGNEAELAGVLAHEMAHVNERHYVRLLQQQRALALGQDFLLGRVKSETAGKLAGTGLELYARSLDKEAEFACDRLAVQQAAGAGYDPFAYVSVLDRMGASEQSDQLALLFKTHPHPAERLDALENLIGGRWDGLGGPPPPQRWVGPGG